MSRRPPVPQLCSVTTTLADEAIYRYPADYLAKIKERMLVQLLVETHNKGMKWVGWPEFEEDTLEAFERTYVDRVLHASVWAVPC